MTIDTSELRRLAKAMITAQAAWWVYILMHPTSEDQEPPDALRLFREARECYASAIYDPRSILALLDEIDALKAEREGGQ